MTENNLLLNKDAKVYIPKNKQNLNVNIINNINSNDRIEEIKNNKSTEIKLNVNAVEYRPKIIDGYKIEGLDDENDELEIIEKVNIKEEKNEKEINKDNDNSLDEFSIINKEIENFIMEQVEEESEESIDKEDWYPNFKNCSCCKGYVYKCEGSSCQNLGMCFCKAAEEYDPDTIYDDF